MLNRRMPRHMNERTTDQMNVNSGICKWWNFGRLIQLRWRRRRRHINYENWRTKWTESWNQWFDAWKSTDASVPLFPFPISIGFPYGVCVHVQSARKFIIHRIRRTASCSYFEIISFHRTTRWRLRQYFCQFICAFCVRGVIAQSTLFASGETISHQIFLYHHSFVFHAVVSLRMGVDGVRGADGRANDVAVAQWCDCEWKDCSLLAYSWENGWTAIAAITNTHCKHFIEWNIQQ